MPKGNLGLRECLSSDLQHRIANIWQQAEKYQETQRGENSQGTQHCLEVEKNLSRLIPDSRKGSDMKEIEIFLLSAAACLHDLGKIAHDLPEFANMDHGKLSELAIRKDYLKFGLDRGEAEVVGFIVGVHHDHRLDLLPTACPLGGEDVDVVKLAALLCLADMLDTTFRRAPDELSAVRPDGSRELPKTTGRRAIRGWSLDEDDRIILQPFDEIDQQMPAYQTQDELKKELSGVSLYLKERRYPYRVGTMQQPAGRSEATRIEWRLSHEPFPGMAYYDRDRASLFKGRDREIDELLTSVMAYPVTLLFGESGAGKTSLIHAGVFFRLEELGWHCAYSRPKRDPVHDIVKALLQDIPSDGCPLPNDVCKAILMTTAYTGKSRLLLVLDELEDLLENEDVVLEHLADAIAAVEKGRAGADTRLLLCYRDDVHTSLRNRLLERICGDAWRYPQIGLERLKRDGARDALITGFASANVGLDPRPDAAGKSLADRLLDDIRKADDSLFPPYLQIVAGAILRSALAAGSTATHEMYESAGRADGIISNYLMGLLDQFGAQKDKAIRVLISLTSALKETCRRSDSQLVEQTGIPRQELVGIVEKLRDLRIVRRLATGETEIISGYLARVIEDTLVDNEAREVRVLQDILEFSGQLYLDHGTPIIYPQVMAKLYRRRRKTAPSDSLSALLLATCLTKRTGCGWYWLRGKPESWFRQTALQLAVSGDQEVTTGASDLLACLARNDPQFAEEMVRNVSPRVCRAGLQALASMETSRYHDLAISHLQDASSSVRTAALYLLARCPRIDDYETIVETARHSELPPKARVAALAGLAAIVETAQLRRLIGDRREFVLVGALTGMRRRADWREMQTEVWELLQNPQRTVRAAALALLAESGTESDLRHIEIIEYSDSWILPRFIDSLERMLLRMELRDVLSRLEARNPPVRAAAVRVIANKGEAISSRVLSRLHDRSRLVSQEVIAAIARGTVKSDVCALEQMLQSSTSADRQRLRVAIAALDYRGDRSAFLMMLNSDDIGARSAALAVLAQSQNVGEADVVRPLLNDENDLIRLRAIVTYEKLSGVREGDFILDLLADEAVRDRTPDRLFFSELVHRDRALYAPECFRLKTDANPTEFDFWTGEKTVPRSVEEPAVQ